MTRRHWCINGRFLTQKVTGVQRYAREILAQLDQLVAEQHVSTAGLAIELAVPPGPIDPPPLRAIQVRVEGHLTGHLWEQWTLPRRAGGKILNLCNTAPLAGRNIVCIHDLNVMEFPQSYSRAFRALYRTLIPAVAKRALGVTTVSHYSAGKIAELGCRRETIIVLPNGHEHAAAWLPSPSAATRSVAGSRTIVVLGSTAPHKNIAMLVALSKDLAQAGLTLAIVGGLDRSVFADVDLSASGARAVGRLSDAELAALFEDCLCLAFPSFVEGFGLPPLEAMARGCPVVSSDRASLPEVCGGAALYAAPDQPQAWLSAFRRLCDDEALRAELSRKGLAQARLFSWRNSALGYLELMSKLDGATAVSGVTR